MGIGMNFRIGFLCVFELKKLIVPRRLPLLACYLKTIFCEKLLFAERLTTTNSMDLQERIKH